MNPKFDFGHLRTRRLSSHIISGYDPVILLPESSLGEYSIRHKKFEAGKSFEMLGAGSVSISEPTTITMLYHNNTLWMSNTPSEVFDMWNLSRLAKGEHILVAGLGLGILVHLLAYKHESITVIELSPEVIELVAHTLPANVEVIQGDFKEWITENDLSKFSFVILDIWSDIDTDHIFDMVKLWKQCQLPGAVWGLGVLIGELSDSFYSHCEPDETADELDELGLHQVADWIRNWHDWNDGYECYCEEDEIDYCTCDEDNAWCLYVYDNLYNAFQNIYRDLAI